MAYDFEEQEKLDQLKAWWKQYGNALTWLVIGVLVAYLAWTGWNYYTKQQSVKAVQLYEELQKSVTPPDLPKLLRATQDLQTKFKSTAYATMASLLTAKAAYDANNIKVAKEQLDWVVKNGNDPKWIALARLHLSGILLDEKSYDAALKTLDDKFPDGFAALVADRKGDILLAQNKKAEAKTNYQLALTKLDKKMGLRNTIQLKIDGLESL